MAITSQTADASKTAAACLRSPFWLFAPLAAAISLAGPTTARADIFKWTDENGRTNFSNVAPTPSENVKNVETVLKERGSASIPDHVATPTEKALLARIESLERQLQSQQYAPPAPAVPAPTPYASYYPPAPPPPPPSSYSSSGYYSYPSYYPPVYYYPAVRSYSYAAYPTRTHVTHPAHVASRGGFSHGGHGHGHRGRR